MEIFAISGANAFARNCHEKAKIFQSKINRHSSETKSSTQARSAKDYQNMIVYQRLTTLTLPTFPAVESTVCYSCRRTMRLQAIVFKTKIVEAALFRAEKSFAMGIVNAHGVKGLHFFSNFKNRPNIFCTDTQYV